MAGKRMLQLITRKKVFSSDQLDADNLKRCLTSWDLTALGVGSSLGVGVYVLVGSVAQSIAGPAVVLSFLIAAVAALFAGLCYAEFGSRVPRAGSAYIYTYVAVGELPAFVIGWNMILESLFGAASVARGLSLYVDLVVDKRMSAWFESLAPLELSVLAGYFDFFAFGVVVIVAVLLAFGVRESTMANNVFVLLNILIIGFIIIAGAVKASPDNWSLPEESTPPEQGVGGFFPFGVWGVLQGAAVCFYGFVGFDSISSASEEAKQPRRSVPLAILVVLLLLFLAYASVSIVVTMMVPYYLQDTVASVATAFSYVGSEWAYWVVSIGAIFAISSSLFGAIFPLPRLLYAMASEGLFFHWFAKISEGRKSPVVGTLFPGFIVALLAGLLSLQQLILMMCVGTLLSYTMVAVSVVVLRYRSLKGAEDAISLMQQMLGGGSKWASKTSSKIVNITLALYILMCVVASTVTVHVENSVIPGIILHALLLPLFAVLALQPSADEEIPFKAPLVPLIPCISIYVNICLMTMINAQTWIRVAIWIIIGIPVYIICKCCYKEHQQAKDDIHSHKNGKSPVQIIIESPTPPDTINRSSIIGGDEITSKEKPIEIKEIFVRNVAEEEIIVQQSTVIENIEEKEANIIDLLDQVLQAEEDTYSAKIDAYGESNEDQDGVIVSTSPEFIPHRNSLTELSDAGSDASLGNQVLSKYDVIAQVHREDLPKVSEEDDQNDPVNDEVSEEDDQHDPVNDQNDAVENEVEIEDHEQVTAFNNSETNSQTDESGYSDTIDRTALTESVEETKEDVPYIPVPPPLDENYFKSPSFKKSYTISARPSKARSIDEEENKPRESIQSNGSQDDSNMIFGSDRQLHFMSKLNTIFQIKIADQDDEQNVIKPGRRSHSTGNVTEKTDYDINHERPSMFLELKKELLARDAAQNLRPVNKEEEKVEESDGEEEVSMTRQDLKSKLENIFAAGGPKPPKPRLMKSNPPTPEDSYQTDTSSIESIPVARIPKMEKNDTLGRQRAKFGEVLNSFRLSLNKDDAV